MLWQNGTEASTTVMHPVLENTDSIDRPTGCNKGELSDEGVLNNKVIQNTLNTLCCFSPSSLPLPFLSHFVERDPNKPCLDGFVMDLILIVLSLLAFVIAFFVFIGALVWKCTRVSSSSFLVDP